MSEESTLDRVAAANPVPDPNSLPDGTIHARTLRKYVAGSPSIDRVDSGRVENERDNVAGIRPQRGFWLAAATFTAVLALGLGFWALRLLGGGGVVDPADIDNSVPTTVSITTSSTTPLLEGSSVDPATFTLIRDFVESLDKPDAARATELVIGDAGEGLIARIATSGFFNDMYRLDDCLAFGAVVRCDVSYRDFFIDQLSMDPWTQQWEFETDNGLLSRVEVLGDYPERTQAMADFEEFVTERDLGAPALVAESASWVRTADAVEVIRRHLVEFTALRSGVPPDVWMTVAAYFETLSAGDLEGFEALLTPGATFDERSGPNGANTNSYAREAPQFIGHFWFEYIGLKTDTTPLECTGDAGSVSCRARNTGVLQLDTGGFEDGLLLFQIEGNLISSISDKFSMPHLGNFYNTWIFDNGPDMTDQFTGGSTDLPETPAVARLLLEWYPRYLADTGVGVPAEYLDGSLLDN